MTRTQAVLVTLVLYKLVLIGIGLFSQRRTRDGVDFFLGGRRLNPLVAAISASASSSSAWTLLGVSGAAYSLGVSSVWLFPACVGGFALNWYVLAPRLGPLGRASGAVTVTDVLAGPEGRPFRGGIVTLSAGIVLFSLLFYVASQFEGAGKAFAETFGLGVTQSVLIGAGVVVFYTLLGGFWAVSLTDTLQGLIMAITAVILPAAALVAVGGPTGLLEGLRTVEAPGYLSLTGNLGLALGLAWVVGILGIGLGYPGQPHVVNRFMAIEEGRRSLVTARRIAMAWAIVVYAGMILLGLCGRVLFPVTDDVEGIFLTATHELFPPVVAGVMIAAVLSAIMSTADSQLLVAGSAVTHDLGMGGNTAGSMLLRSRGVILLLSAGAAAAALLAPQAIFDRVLFAWAAMGAAFGPLLLVTVFRGSPPGGRALISMILGFASSVGAYWWADGEAAGLLERVAPFCLALGVLLLPSRRR